MACEILSAQKFQPVAGQFVVAARLRSNRAVCWASSVDGSLLRSIFAEVDSLGLARPITIYGHTCLVSETRSFRFEQVTGSVSGLEVGAPTTKGDDRDDR